MSGDIRQSRNSTIAKMADEGFKTRKFRETVRETLQELQDIQWEYACQIEDRAVEPWELKDPYSWPRPTGWRQVTKEDNRGDEWVVFECVEPTVSTLSENKILTYLELWFYFDSLDDLVVLHLYRMDEDGSKYKIDLQRIFSDYT